MDVCYTALDNRLVTAARLQEGDEICLPGGQRGTVSGKDAPRNGSGNYRLHPALHGGGLRDNVRPYYPADAPFWLAARPTGTPNPAWVASPGTTSPSEPLIPPCGVALE